MSSSHGHAVITSAGSLVYDMVAQSHQYFKKLEMPNWLAYMAR